MSELDNSQRENISSPGISSLGRPRRLSIFLPIQPATQNLENAMDFKNVCRVCADVTENIVHILTGEGCQLNLSHKLSKHLKINVSEGDYPRMPVVLCMSCTNTLLAFDEMVSGVMAADAALRQRSSHLQNMREMEQREERINRNLQEHGVRRCPLCSAALATSRFTAHLRTRHVDQLFECSNCNSLVERNDLVPHIKEHAEHIAAAWSVVWNDAASQLTGRRHNTRDEISVLVPEIVELEFSDSDAEDFEPFLGSVLRTIEAPTSIQTQQEPEIVEVQEIPLQESSASENPPSNPPQGSLVSENSPANSPQDSLVSENPSANPPQESWVSENSPANPPQECLVLENSPANSPQESMVSENPSANPLGAGSENSTNSLQETLVSENSPQESMESENPSANPAQQSSVSENPPANPPQQSLVSENPPTNPSVVLNDEPEKGEETKKIKLEEKPTRSCPHCTRTFKASSSYFYHIKYFHNQSKEHACGKCGKRFGTRGILRAHASVHTGARDHQCGQCPKKFRTKASLYIHQQTHGSVKKYSCNQCPMAFRWNTQLRRHLTRHAAERKHACTTCGKAFSVRADLLRHGRTHARAEHACPEAPCAARFAQPRYLRSHVTRKHANKSRDAEN